MASAAASLTQETQPPSPPEKKRNAIQHFLEMIKFEHTIFALPFAYVGALLGGRGHISLQQFIIITIAMITARTAGMSLNRLIDKDIDALNPRTANREFPKKIIPVQTVWKIVIVSLVVFTLSTAFLNRLALFLSPLAIAILFGYSYLKRFTWLCHLGLGVVLACAPIGGWIAVAGNLDKIPLALGTAMIFWLAGFDVLYGCQDIEFDKKVGLFSIPQHFGIPKALWISSFFHALTFIFLALTGILANLGLPFTVGLILIGFLLIYEHLIVTSHDLSRVNQAFFQANAAISVITLTSTILSYWIAG